MIASRRWQDWAAAAVGVLAVVSPFFFASSLNSVEAWTAYIVGGLIFLVGIATLLYPSFTFGEFIQVMFAVALFFSPWLIGFTGVAAMAWTAWILGVALAVIVGTALVWAGTPRQAVTT